MKYRVRLDMSFDNESDARLLVNYASNKSSKVVNIKEDKDDEEVSYCELELCGHEEGQPCTRLERHEFGKRKERRI